MQLAEWQLIIIYSLKCNFRFKAVISPGTWSYCWPNIQIAYLQKSIHIQRDRSIKDYHSLNLTLVVDLGRALELMMLQLLLTGHEIGFRPCSECFLLEKSTLASSRIMQGTVDTWLVSGPVSWLATRSSSRITSWSSSKQSGKKEAVYKEQKKPITEWSDEVICGLCRAY